MLDDGVREDDVELTLGEGQRARVALHVRDLRVPGTEAGAVVEAERGDPFRPRVVLLEEVERAAAVALAEATLVRADVQHGGLRRGVQLVEEQPQLALARAEGDVVDESHRRKYPVSRGR